MLMFAALEIIKVFFCSMFEECLTQKPDETCTSIKYTVSIIFSFITSL